MSKQKFTNLEKIYWPKQKYTKGDMIEYYQSVAKYILPYLKNRPIMLRRFPNGIEGENFMQKNMESAPSWVETIPIQHEKKEVRYILIQNKDTLEYVANLGAIELHPFLSTIENPDYPKYFVLDLDPESVPFAKVVETAQIIHQLLDQFNIPNFCKTSGKRGIHVCIPFNEKYTYDEGIQFGQLISHLIHQELPKITSVERKPSKRQKKIYLDIYQNHYKQTVVAPYSLRAQPFAPVSTPLEWDELEKGIDPKDFNIETVPKRLKKLGDVFSPTLKKGVDMKKFIQIIEQ